MTKKENKYIDVEKLKEKIKSFSATEYSDNTFGDDVANGALDYVLEEIIPSLQQEQTEVDFEKELDRIWFDNKFGNRFDNSAVDFANVREICRHFYELGLNARKEE